MLTNKYYLAAVDMYTGYGFIPDQDCHQTFLQKREVKERFSNDWPEKNGKEYDLISPLKFDDRLFKMTGFIEGTTLVNANTKVNNLETAMSTAGTKNLQIISLALNFAVFYLKIDVQNQTPLKFNSKTYLKVSIYFQEVQP